jgi:hypothetical protein
VFEYEVTNTGKEAVTVDGLDVLPPESTTSYDQRDADSFAHMRGLKLLTNNMPEGVEVTIVVKGETE